MRGKGRGNVRFEPGMVNRGEISIDYVLMPHKEFTIRGRDHGQYIFREKVNWGFTIINKSRSL